MEHLCTCGLTDLQWPPRACPLISRERRVSHSHFSVQKGARESATFAAIMCPRSALLVSPHWCKLTADFHPTVKAALRHESADSEEDRKDLGCHLGWGLTGCFQFKMWLCATPCKWFNGLASQNGFMMQNLLTQPVMS